VWRRRRRRREREREREREEEERESWVINLPYSSDVSYLVAEIVSREPLVKHRCEQLEKLISS
jgi:hypothetical protein